jgi:hypothetical protein
MVEEAEKDGTLVRGKSIVIEPTSESFRSVEGQADIDRRQYWSVECRPYN